VFGFDNRELSLKANAINWNSLKFINIIPAFSYATLIHQIVTFGKLTYLLQKILHGEKYPILRTSTHFIRTFGTTLVIAVITVNRLSSA